MALVPMVSGAHDRGSVNGTGPVDESRLLSRCASLSPGIDAADGFEAGPWAEPWCSSGFAEACVDCWFDQIASRTQRKTLSKHSKNASRQSGSSDMATVCKLYPHPQGEREHLVHRKVIAAFIEPDRILTLLCERIEDIDCVTKHDCQNLSKEVFLFQT